MHAASSAVRFPLTHDEKLGCYVSEPKLIQFLANTVCRFVIEGYESDADLGELRRAVQNALAASPDLLTAAEPYVVQYREQMLALVLREGRASRSLVGVVYVPF